MTTVNVCCPVVASSPDPLGTQELLNVIARWKPSFYRLALRRLRNEADAQDAVQDAFLAAYEHLGQFHGRAKMSTWVTRIVINATRMQARRVSRRSHVPLSTNDEEHEGHLPPELLWDRRPTPEQLLQRRELEDRLANAFMQLPAYLHTTFHMRTVAGLSIRETAQRLGLPEGTVKARFSRARVKLKRLVRQTRRSDLPLQAGKDRQVGFCPGLTATASR